MYVIVENKRKGKRETDWRGGRSTKEGGDMVKGGCVKIAREFLQPRRNNYVDSTQQTAAHLLLSMFDSRMERNGEEKQNTNEC